MDTLHSGVSSKAPLTFSRPLSELSGPSMRNVLPVSSSLPSPLLSQSWSDSRFASSLSILFKGSDDEVVDCWFDSDSVVVAVVAAVDAT